MSEATKSALDSARSNGSSSSRDASFEVELRGKINVKVRSSLMLATTGPDRPISVKVNE